MAPSNDNADSPTFGGFVLQCPICLEDGFKNTFGIKCHQRARHRAIIPPRCPLVSCKQCPTNYATFNHENMNNHLRKHCNGPQEYCCAEGAFITDPSSLRRHKYDNHYITIAALMQKRRNRMGHTTVKTEHIKESPISNLKVPDDEDPPAPWSRSRSFHPYKISRVTKRHSTRSIHENPVTVKQEDTEIGLFSPKAEDTTLVTPALCVPQLIDSCLDPSLLDDGVKIKTEEIEVDLAKLKIRDDDNSFPIATQVLDPHDNDSKSSSSISTSSAMEDPSTPPPVYSVEDVSSLFTYPLTQSAGGGVYNWELGPTTASNLNYDWPIFDEQQGMVPPYYTTFAEADPGMDWHYDLLKSTANAPLEPFVSGEPFGNTVFAYN